MTMDMMKVYNNLGAGIDVAKSIYDSATSPSQIDNLATQIALNRLVQQDNLENVTKPVFAMENAEYDRRTELQQQYWEKQFNMQNEYNSPQAQLQRMREAGLNPALLQGETGAMPAAGGGTVNPTMNEAASSFMDAPNYAQIQQASAQSDLLRQQAIATSIDNITRPMLNWGKIKIQDVQLDLARSETKFTYAKTNAVKAEMKVMEENAKLIHQNIENAKKSYEILHNEVRRTLAEAMTSEFNADMTMFNRDIMREAMQSQDPESGAGYYDPVNSFLARWWKNNKFWSVQQYIDEHNLKPYQAMVLRSQAALNGSMTEMYNAEVPILKIEAGIKGLDFNMKYDTYDLRKENILGTLSWQNGVLKLKSQTYNIDFLTGWGQKKLHQGLDALNTIADYNSWLPDRMLKKVGNVIGTFSGKGGENNVPGVPGSQSTGTDIWEMGNSGGYNLNYGW